MDSFGSMWPKRSITPCSPKSGEQDDQMAPIELAANMQATVSGILGIMAEIRSPLPIVAADPVNLFKIRQTVFRPSMYLVKVGIDSL